MKRIAFVFLLVLFMPRHVVDAQDGPYRFVREIAIGGEGGWDYLSVDPTTHRLFVSHGTRIVVVDTQRDTIAGEITDTPGVHGLTVASDLGRGFVANGGDNTVSIVDLVTLKTLQKVSTGADPDTIAYDPVHHVAYAFAKAGKTATAFDARSGAIVAEFPLGGTPQATVVDAAHGKVYVNLQDKNAIAVIDTASRKLTDTWSIEPGENQSGLAIDLEHQRLFAGCRNKLMVMVDADNGSAQSVGPRRNDGVQASRTPWLRTRKYPATAMSSTPLIAITFGAPMNVAR